MSRNQNSHFSLAPRVNHPRSRFDISHTVKMTGDAGLLIPFECKEIIPGDTFTVSTSMLARMQTLIVPLMDDMYVDVYWFYVPNRLLWKHWENFCGETDEPWFDEDANYTVPGITFDVEPGTSAGTDRVLTGTVADYLGLPLPAPGTYSTKKQKTVTHLPFRGYVKIWNDWFRDTNTEALAAFNTEDNSVTMNNTSEAWYGGALLPVNKYRDYFTSCLPLPQRGDAVHIALTNDTMPIDTYSNKGKSTAINVHVRGIDQNWNVGEYHNPSIRMLGSDGNYDYGQAYLYNTAVSVTGDPPQAFQKWTVDLSNVSGISINELRYAFATQRYLEAMARGGNRYIDYLATVYGVQSPDARLQRSELLGGSRFSVNVNQAIQNSETSTTPLGNIGAYSLTTDSQFSFEKSFVEAGYLYGLLCVRYDHSYQDGIDRFWTRRNLEDFYNPFFANIGEQPVLNQEIFTDGSSSDNEVFGYQEAWADYRYSNNAIRGEMRSRYAQSLDYWHLGDNYTSLPYLDDDWRVENGATIDRAIAVSQRLANQFLFDIYIDIKATRPMPLFSVPGLDIL